MSGDTADNEAHSWTSLVRECVDDSSAIDRFEALCPELIFDPSASGHPELLDTVLELADAGDWPYIQLIAWEMSTHKVGHLAAPMELLRRAQSTFEARGDDRGTGLAAALDATRLLLTGQLDKVADAVNVVRAKLGQHSPHLEALLANASWTPYASGDLDGALRLADQAVSQAILRGNRYGEGVGWFHIGFFTIWRGDLAKAADAFRRCLSALDDDGAQFEVPMALAGLGVVDAMRGRLGDADEHFERALSTSASNDLLAGWLRAAITTIRADVFAWTRPGPSSVDARQAHSELTNLGDSWWSRWALRAAAQCLMASGQTNAARDSLEWLSGVETMTLERAHTLQLLGEATLDVDRTAAEALLRQALAIYKESGSALRAVECTTALLSTRPSDSRRLRADANQWSKNERAFAIAWRGRSTLEVSTLGTTDCILDGRRVQFPTVLAEEAFFSLVTEPRLSISVERLATRLWPDVTQSRLAQRLSTLLWQLRTSLGRSGERIQRTREIIILNLDDAECDLRQVLSGRLGYLGLAEQRRRRPADLTEDEMNLLSPPLLPRFAAHEWVVDLQHRIDALVVDQRRRRTT